MQKLLLALFAIGTFQFSNAQTVITKNVVESYIQDELSRICTALLKAGLENKIPVYLNDSLSSTYTVTELEHKSIDTVYKPTYVEDTITIAAAMEYKTANLKGLEFGFSRSSNFEQNSYSNHLIFIAPQAPLIVQGIDLGIQNIGLFKLNDIEQVLDKYDFAFLKGLAFQTQVRGNLQTCAVQFYNEPDSTNVEYVVWRSFSKESTRTRFDLAFASRYTYQLLSAFVAFNTNKRGTFYKDKFRTRPYLNLTDDLSNLDTVQIAVGDSLIPQTVFMIPDFGGPFEFKVHPTTTDRIIELLYKDAFKTQSIFFSWNDVAKSFQPYDRVVLKHMISVMH